MPDQIPVLELKHATRKFKNGDSEVLALNDLNIKIYQGEFVAIVGQSGSGKSTMMNILGCLDRLSEGQYFVGGRDVSKLTSKELAALRRDEFGFVFQRYNLLPGLTARENVEVPSVYQGIRARLRHQRSKALLVELGLAERVDFRPNQLSGGQQQRVAISRALMNEPRVILADEPTGALDRASSEDVMRQIRDLHEKGHTIVLITHDPEIAQHAERQVLLQDGKIVKDTGFKEATKETEAQNQSKGLSFLASCNIALSIAFKSLKFNWFRTALTLLGIIIGVGAVVVLMAVGTGQREDILGRMTAMGTNLISVYGRGGEVLTQEDAKWIARIDGVAAVVPTAFSNENIRFGNKDIETSIDGVTPDLVFVRDWNVREGEFFTQTDVDMRAPVIVLGQTVVNELFAPGDQIIGEFVSVGNLPMEIIGIMEAKGSTGWGGDQDDVGIVPLTTLQSRLTGSVYIRSITAKIASLEDIAPVEEEITALLLEDHEEDEFRVNNMASFVQSANETATGMTLFLAVVAAISLLVGGIGVMNIMLVSVTERTREIGVRMATGARRRDIMLQFLIEAVTVCALGGAIGLVLGWLAGFGFRAMDMTTIYTPFPAIAAFLSACFVGIVFGIFPARQAANLDPVIALQDN